MPRYRCFGRIVESPVNFDFAQEDFVTAGESAIRLQIERTSSVFGGDLMVERLNEDSAVMSVPTFGEFLYRGAEEILTARVNESVDEQSMKTTILNQGLPFALAVHGELVLHAAAIETSGGAVLFMGRRGVGKSHFAAHAVAAGYKFLADDFIRLVPGREVMAIPSFPEIRIFKDKAAEFARIGRVAGDAGPKSCLSVTRGFGREPLPVRAIYHVIRDGEGAALGQPLSPMGRIQALMDNCLFYPTLKPQDTERRLTLVQQIAESNVIGFFQYELGSRFAKDLNEVRECFNL